MLDRTIIQGQGQGIGKVTAKSVGTDEEQRKRKELREEKKKQRKELWKLGDIGGQSQEGTIMSPDSVSGYGVPEWVIETEPSESPIKLDNALRSDLDISHPSYLGAGYASRSRCSIGNDHSGSNAKSSRSSIVSGANSTASASRSSVVSKESKMVSKMAVVFLKDSAKAIELVRSDSQKDSDPTIAEMIPDTLTSSIIKNQSEMRATLTCTDGTLASQSPTPAEVAYLQEMAIDSTIYNK